MSKIDFSELEDILNSSINISLTEDQYKKITGRNANLILFVNLH